MDTFKAFFTGVLEESVTYEVPNSPKALMADFYMLSYLDTINFAKLAQLGNADAVRFDDDFKDDLEYAQSKLYPYLKKHMLEAVFFSMCAEIRHIFDGKMAPHVMEKCGPIIQTFHKYYRHYTQDLGSKDPRMVDTAEYSQDQRGYRESFAAIKKVMQRKNMSGAQMVEFFEFAFREGNWSSSYGGEAWANIARGWLSLLNTKDNNYPVMAVNIDHVYDLQHNTGTVFNKLRKYYDGGYEWIKNMLDFKANLKSIADLVPHCSSSMKKLAQPILKAAHIGLTKDKKIPAGDSYAAKHKTTPVGLMISAALESSGDVLLDSIEGNEGSEFGKKFVKAISEFISITDDGKDFTNLTGEETFVRICAHESAVMMADDQHIAADVFGEMNDDFSSLVPGMKGKKYKYTIAQYAKMMEQGYKQNTEYVGKSLYQASFVPNEQVIGKLLYNAKPSASATVTDAEAKQKHIILKCIAISAASIAASNAQLYVDGEFDEYPSLVNFVKKIPAGKASLGHEFMQHIFTSLIDTYEEGDAESHFIDHSNHLDNTKSAKDDFTCFVPGMKGLGYSYSTNQWQSLIKAVTAYDGAYILNEVLLAISPIIADILVKSAKSANSQETIPVQTRASDINVGVRQAMMAAVDMGVDAILEKKDKKGAISVLVFLDTWHTGSIPEFITDCKHRAANILASDIEYAAKEMEQSNDDFSTYIKDMQGKNYHYTTSQWYDLITYSVNNMGHKLLGTLDVLIQPATIKKLKMIANQSLDTFNPLDA